MAEAGAPPAWLSRPIGRSSKPDVAGGAGTGVRPRSCPFGPCCGVVYSDVGRALGDMTDVAVAVALTRESTSTNKGASAVAAQDFFDSLESRSDASKLDGMSH